MTFRALLSTTTFCSFPSRSRAHSLGNEAHGLGLDHPIFRAPLHPEIVLDQTVTPGGYGHWERDQPAKLATWKVQDGNVGTTVDYGLVSNPYGFEDSPDVEWISSGINSKGPKSMALGRQGNCRRAPRETATLNDAR